MDTKHNIENVNWDLLARYLSHEASGEECREVEEWAALSEDNRELLSQCRQSLAKARLWYETRRFNSLSAWEKLQSQLQEQAPVIQLVAAPATKKLYPSFIRVAAVALLAVTLGITAYYYGFRRQAGISYTEVTSAQQVIPGIALPDGSVITLNSNSRLVYPSEFNGKYREVTMEGEAFFEVQPDPNHPFIITAGKTRITVLGTSFNVCAYPGQDRVEVVVESGKVQVTAEGLQTRPVGQVTLTPGERGTFSQGDLSLAKSVNGDPNIYAWKTRQLVFNETNLSEVLRTLEKVYHVRVDTKGLSADDLLLTANFSDQSVDFILDVVRLTFNLELSTVEGSYILHLRENTP